MGLIPIIWEFAIYFRILNQVILNIDNIGLDCGADVDHDKENYARGNIPFCAFLYGTSNIFIL